MQTVFADAAYWIATINPRDNLHQRATDVSAQLGNCIIVTSEMVLVEVLNALASYGPHLRQAAERMVRMIMDDATTDVVPQTRNLFQNALVIYSDHPDKEWSLTDCASFVIIDQKNITDVLTSDRHFEQTGYRALLRE
jgi:uncharacterized protein